MLGDKHIVKHRLGLPQTDILEGTGHTQRRDLIRRRGQHMVSKCVAVQRLLALFPGLQRLVVQRLLRGELGGVHIRVLTLILLLHLSGGMVPHDARLIEAHPPVGGGVHTGDDIERCGLASAVGADQRHDLALVDLQIQIVHGYHAAKLHSDVLHGQYVLAHLDVTSFAALSFFLNSFPKKLMMASHENSLSPMMPLRKNSTTIIMITENTSIRKPPRMNGMFTPR